MIRETSAYDARYRADRVDEPLLVQTANAIIGCDRVRNRDRKRQQVISIEPRRRAREVVKVDDQSGADGQKGERQRNLGDDERL